MWWAARLRRRPARAVLRRGPEVSCFPSPRHEAVGTAGGRSSQAARPGALARAKHPLQLQAQPQARGFSLSLAARVRVRGAGALRSPFPAPALPEAAHACGLRAAKTREERESGGILRSAAFPCWAAWQRGRRNAESAAGSSMAMRNPMQIIKFMICNRSLGFIGIAPCATPCDSHGELLLNRAKKKSLYTSSLKHSPVLAPPLCILLPEGRPCTVCRLRGCSPCSQHLPCLWLCA